MTNDEAKFILGVCRPDGRDAEDPTFSESLAQASRDPALSVWLKQEQALDEALSIKMAEIPVPDLRELILAGARAGRRRRVRWLSTGWLAAAAAIIVLWVVAGRLRSGAGGRAPDDLTAFALHDLATDVQAHLGAIPALASLQRHLGDPATRLGAGLDLDLSALQRGGCRVVRVAGRDVYELCFARDGEYHLYVARRSDLEAARTGGMPEFRTQGSLASATWSDARYVYVAVTDGGVAALRRVL